MTPDKKGTARLNVAVAISGGGRTLANLLLHQPRCAYRVVGVISSGSSCRGNLIAQKHRLPLFVGDFAGAGREGPAGRRLARGAGG